jgi:hypothetical protein
MVLIETLDLDSSETDILTVQKSRSRFDSTVETPRPKSKLRQLKTIEIFLTVFCFVFLVFRSPSSSPLLGFKGGGGDQRPGRSSGDGSLLGSRAQQDHLGVGVPSGRSRKGEPTVKGFCY